MIILYEYNNSTIILEDNILSLNIDIKNFNEDNIIYYIEYFCNFWLISKENDKIFYMIINLINIPILSQYIINILYEKLNNLKQIFETKLHLTCLIVDTEYKNKILNPLLTKYNNCKPLEMFKHKNDAIKYIKQIDI